MKEIIVDGKIFVEKFVEKKEQSNFCIVRTYTAGVHAGYLKERQGKEVVLTNAIRIWSWKGAASLSEMAMSGVKYPKECKFAVAVDEIFLLEAIEIIKCTEEAMKNIQGVTPWTTK